MFTALPSCCSETPPGFEGIVYCSECEDGDTLCDGCLNLALLPLPLLPLPRGCEILFS